MANEVTPAPTVEEMVGSIRDYYGQKIRDHFKRWHEENADKKYAVSPLAGTLPILRKMQSELETAKHLKEVVP